MPQNYEITDGTVLKAAQMALDTGNVNYILIWIPEASEKTLKNLFESTFCKLRSGKDVKGVAVNWYYNTVKRIHRANKRMFFERLKPSGFDERKVIVKVKKAIQTGNCDELIGIIPEILEDDFRNRFYHVMKKKNHDTNNIVDGRTYVAALTDFIIYLYDISACITGQAGQMND